MAHAFRSVLIALTLGCALHGVACGNDDEPDGSLCSDGVSSPGEVGIDCGGPCAPCSSVVSCDGPDDCGGGPCADGVCCDAPCDAPCEACIESKTGSPSGRCAAVAAGTDPDDECGDVALCTGETCSGTRGACEPAEAGLVCRDATGDCDASEICDGLAASCPMDALVAAGLDPLGSCGEAEACDGAGECANAHRWSKRFGALEHDYVELTVDGADNVVLAGRFTGTVDFGGGPLTSPGLADGYLVKLAPNGDHLWSKRFGAGSLTYLNDVAADPGDNLVVTGAFTLDVDFGGGPLTNAGGQDIVVAKYAPAGNPIWSKGFGSTGGDGGRGVAIDAAGNVFVTGSFSGTVDFGGGPLTSAGSTDVFLAKFSAGGNHLWSKRFGSTETESGESVAVDGAGNVVISGRFMGTVSFGGGVFVSAGARDFFVAKYDASGDHLWSRGTGGAENDDGYAVAADEAGNVTVAGRFSGGDFGAGPVTTAGASDAFLVRYDAMGEHVWSRHFGAADVDYVRALSLAQNGEVSITGIFGGSIDFGGGPLTTTGILDVFVARYDAAGEHLWSQRFGSTSYVEGTGVAVDSTQSVLVTGSFEDTASFGGVPLTSAGAADIFVAKFGF